MSDSPIFDQLSAERNYQRMLDWKTAMEDAGASVGPSQPDPFLDGPIHMIGAQTFPDDHIETSALVREGLVAGLKGSPFEGAVMRYFSDSAISAKAAVQYPDLHLKRGPKEEVQYGSEEFRQMFSDYMAQVSQAMHTIREQGGIVTRCEAVSKLPNGEPGFVVEGEVPVYKPLFDEGASEE
jgi:hypothetical protein